MKKDHKNFVNKNLNGQGFTLIETLIYIALFTILMVAGFATAYSLIEGGNSLNNKTVTNSELDFVLRKIDWALSDINVITVPSSGMSSTLSVTKSYGPVIQIRRNNNKIEMNEGSGWLPLTTDNVVVSALGFQVISGNPSGIIATTTINGIRATTTKYIRK